MLSDRHHNRGLIRLVNVLRQQAQRELPPREKAARLEEYRRAASRRMPLFPDGTANSD